MSLGHLYGVSVGPGAPDLLTLRAVRVIREAPVVAWPACKPGAPSYARRIIAEYLDPERQELLGLVFPMSRDQASLLPVWRENAAILAGHLRAGRDVAFVTEGDASTYSTFQHVREAVAEQLPEAGSSVVPGVSSVQAAAALAGRALAQADERVAIVPATWRIEELRETLLHNDTVVLLKVARELPRVIDLLAETGRLGEAVLVSRGTAAQSIVSEDLERFRDRRLNYLTLVLVARRGSFADRVRAGEGA